jgi:hypothetical protein
MTEGQCLCGAVRYEVDGDLGETRLCYCVECRRASGSAFTANVRVPASNYRLLSGREHIREYESSPGRFRAFCSRCGSPVHARGATDPDWIRIRLGGLDADAPARVAAHVWVSEKPRWYVISDDHPQHQRSASR